MIEAPTPPPTRNESTDSFTSPMIHSSSLTSSMNHSGSHNVPATLLPSIHERFPTAVDFSEQFFDGKFCVCSVPYVSCIIVS